MQNKVLAAIRKYNMVKKGQNVTVALSGGADSVALLHCMLALKSILGISVSAAHLNHGIRGEEAERDENFCRNICQNYGVEIVCKRVNVPEAAESRGESVELCARNLRYEFFDELDTDLVATAHTASDTAETVLYNLARGGGIKAMAGIPRKRGRIIRPMLDITRSEVEEYCRANALEYVTDSTNLSDEYTRNRIRHSIVPRMQEINPAFEQNAARSAALIKTDADFLDALAEEKYRELLKNGRLSLDSAKLADSLLTRVVALYLGEYAQSDDGCHIDAVADLVRQGSGIVSVKNGFEAQAARGWLWVFKREDAVDFCLELVQGINSVGRYNIEARFLGTSDIKDAIIVNKKLLNGAIDCDKIVGKLVIRNRRAGDKFCPLGRGVTKSLKNIFAEMDIPFEERDKIPMVADDRGILWMPGQRVAQRAAADKDSQNIVVIKEC